MVKFPCTLCYKEHVCQITAKSVEVYYAYHTASQNHSLIPPPLVLPCSLAMIYNSLQVRSESLHHQKSEFLSVSSVSSTADVTENIVHQFNINMQ